ncbi:uncharacterized protein [Notamacropus eugenii]|uniref:uncharacterized protein n=1 Tax=Notamacropus eugenii TaxID=9315 RepID=UPI003B671F79
MNFAKKHSKKELKKMKANNAKAIKTQAEATNALSNKASKAKLLRHKMPKTSASCTGHKMATKHLGSRVSIKCPGPKIMKLNSKVARTTGPQVGKPIDSKAAKPTYTKVTNSATKFSQSDSKATKSGPKASKSDARVTKSDSKTAKSEPKAAKDTKHIDSKVAKPTDSKSAEFKPKQAASPKPYLNPKPPFIFSSQRMEEKKDYIAMFLDIRRNGIRDSIITCG